jgi:hypothetical protein
MIVSRRAAVQFIALGLSGTLLTAHQPPVRPVDDYLATSDVARYALAVGVEHYDEFPNVPNAISDLNVAVAALQRANFSTMRVVPQATAAKFRTALGELTQLVDGRKRPAIVAIFFSGHGFQDGGDNFLVPMDARRAHLLEDSIDVADVVRRFVPRDAGVSILFLDACRTFTSLTSAAPQEGLDGRRPGFGQVRNFDGAVLGMAAGYDQAALSRAFEGDTNSPFTEALLHHLNRPELSVASMFGAVYGYVKLKTQDRQQPEILVRARIDTFGFMPRSDTAAWEAEARHWRATLETNRYDCVKGFLIDYPDSRFTASALKWLAEWPPGFPTTGGGVGCPTR